MKFELKLVGRYLRMPKKRPLARLTAWIAIIGTAFGVASFIVAQGLANGFRMQMQEKILANTAHLSFFRTDGADISDWQKKVDFLQTDSRIRSVEPTVYRNAVLLNNGILDYVLLRSEPHLTENKETDEKPKIKIGENLAEKTGLIIGEKVKILTVNPLDNSPLSHEAEISGTFKTGIFEYDSTWVYVSLKDAAKLSGNEKPTATAINIFLHDIYSAEKFAEELQKKIGNEFKVLSWQAANRPLFAAMALEKRVVLLIISLIILLSALNITTNLALVINERRADVAVLRTFGAKTHNIVFAFLLKGMILGIIGAILGIIFGLFVCYAGNYWRLVALPQDVYSIEYVEFLPQFGEIFGAFIGVLILSFAASILPAFWAAKVKPWDSLARF